MRLIAMMILFFSQAALAQPVCDYHFNLENATYMADDSPQVIRQDIGVYRGQNSPSGRCDIYRLFFAKGLANDYQRKAFDPNGASMLSIPDAMLPSSRRSAPSRVT